MVKLGGRQRPVPDPEDDEESGVGEIVGGTDEFYRQLDALIEAGKQGQETATRGGRGGPPAPRLMPLILELKILTKDLKIVRLGNVINYAQVDFVTRCEKQLISRGQIRMCVLKARQLGLSTIIEGIIFILSLMFDNYKSLIVSHEDKSARAILAMTKRYWRTYTWKDMHQETYSGKNHLAWDNGSDIDVATAKNTDAGRSQTIQALHASEVAFWPDPDTLMTGLGQSVPTYGLNCIFIESTANGVGNYFHRTCNLAMKGENEYEFAFYPWYQHPEYTAAYIPEDEVHKFNLTNLDEEELRLRNKFGIDDARLLWRRWAIINRCLSDVNKFHQEYPTTPHEAFISTGRNVFPLGKMLDHYEPLVGKKGRLIRNRNRIQFVEDPNGYLTLFAEPSDDQDWGVYLAGGDPTHTTAGDYACIQIINRRTLEQVAVYRRKIDPINFGKDMQLVGYFFNTALLAPEREGPGYATVGCVVADNYPYVYRTQNVAKMQGIPTENLGGWATNTNTKHLAIAALLKALVDPLVVVGNSTIGLLLHDETTFLEMRDYVTTADGQGYENSDGSEYDDGVMAMAIAITVHNIEPAPPPYEMVQEHEAPRRMAAVRTSGTGPTMRSGKQRPIDNQPTDTRVARTGSLPDAVELLDEAVGDHLPHPQDRLGGPLPRHPDFPEDFTEDEAPWEAWGTPRNLNID